MGGGPSLRKTTSPFPISHYSPIDFCLDMRTHKIPPINISMFIDMTIVY